MHRAVINRIFLVLVMGLLAGGGVLLLALPQRDFSPMENRSLQTSISLEGDTFSIQRFTEDAQNFMTDQAPGRDAWIQIQAVADASFLRALRNGVVFGSDGRLYEDTSTWREGVLQANVGVIEQMASLLETPVSLMLIPTSAAVYPQGIPAWIPVEDQALRIQDLYAQLQHARPIDALEALLASSSDPLYYRTDHHWTAQGARRMYEVLCEHYNLSPTPEGALDRVEVPGFYGSYYAHAPSPWIRADVFSVDLARGVTLDVEGRPMPGLLNEQQAAARDKYAAVLYGNHGRGTLLNAQAAGGCLVVLQDSYANAVLPALAGHFQRIETVDLRYFSGDLLSFLEETEADQILCMYGLSTLVGDRSLLLQSALWPL